MPTGTINIYLASSFLSTASGSKDVRIDFPVWRADNLGEGILPVYYTVTSGVISTQSFEADVEFQDITSSGFINTINELAIGTLTSGLGLDCINIYSMPVTSSGLTKKEDIRNTYTANYNKIVAFKTYVTQFLSGRAYPYFTSTSLRYYTKDKADITKDYVSNYSAPSGINLTKDVLNFSYFPESLKTDGVTNAFMDSFFAGYVLNHSPFQVICGRYSVVSGSQFDVEVASGHVKHVGFQSIIGLTTSDLLSDFDVHAGVVVSGVVDFELETIDGRIAFYDFDLYAGVSGIRHGYTLDIDLLSLKISDLSITEGTYINANGTLCVDVTDDVCNVVTSGCHFVLDGTVVSGIFTPITDGYRMCYNPVDNFVSVMGAVEFQAVAQNEMGVILTKSFYLTSGYSVEYDNVGQDYGWGNKVIIRMSAENFASCPGIGTFAYETESVFKESRDLPTIINGLPLLWNSDLPAAIYPNSTAFFYGKIIKVEVRAKDYSGNEMEPFIFEFKIENKPN
jgi:hypothetical protein